jgi:hypothetical protein
MNFHKGPIMKQKPFVEDIETYAQDIVDTVREPLLMLDTTLRVRSANRAFTKPVELQRLLAKIGALLSGGEPTL